MRKQIINENWDIEEVVDLDDLAAVLFKYGSNQCGYAEAFDFDDVVARQAYDNLVNQYKEANADELTHIYLVKLPNTPQVISLLDKALYNGNERDPEAIEAVNNLCNRADCETLDSWGGCLSEGKKKKKVCSSSYCGFTDPELNIKHFNRCMGTGGLQNPDAPHLVVGDTLPNAPVADAGSSDGASDAGSSSAGEGGAMGESLNEEKGFAIKRNGQAYSQCFKTREEAEAKKKDLNLSDATIEEVNCLAADFEPVKESLTENDKAVDINDMKQLIWTIVDGFKLTTENSSKLALCSCHANGDKTEEIITYHPAGENATERYNFTVSGGLNGAGSWSDYLNDLSDFAQSLKKQSGWEPVVIDVKSDVLDDIFYVEFNLFNPGEKKNESLTEDLIVIEPFEAKEKLNKLVTQVKEQEDDEVKKSLLDLLNIYLFQTVGPEDRENCDLTEDEWKETSEFAQKETDKYYEEHPEELPGTEEHAEEKGDTDSEEVDESLTEAHLDYSTQYAKMKALENGTRKFNAAAASDEKLIYNWKLCKSEGFKYAQSVMEQEMLRRGGYLADMVNKSKKIKVDKSFRLTAANIDGHTCTEVWYNVNHNWNNFWKNTNWSDALIVLLLALATKDADLSNKIRQEIIKKFDITVDELKAIVMSQIGDQIFFNQLKGIVTYRVNSSAEVEHEGKPLTEASGYSHKLEDRFEIPPQIRLLDQKKVEDFIKQVDPEEPFTIGYITPLYLYSEIDDKFNLVKATEMTGYTGIDYRDAGLANTKNHDERVANAKRQIDTYKQGVDKNHGFKLNPSGEMFSTSYRDTNKLALNPEKSNEYVEYEYELDDSGSVKLDSDGKPIVKLDSAGNKVVKNRIDMNKILFYPEVGSYPVTHYYLDLHDRKGFRPVKREVLADTIYQYILEIEKAARKGVSLADLKWLKKSGYGDTTKDADAAIQKFYDTHPGNIAISVYRKAQELGVNPEEYAKEHPFSTRWSWDDLRKKIRHWTDPDSEMIMAQDEATSDDIALDASKGYGRSATGIGLGAVEAKPQVRALYSNQVYYISGKPGTLGNKLAEGLTEAHRDDPEVVELTNEIKDDVKQLKDLGINKVELDEAKRYVKRYYVRPQNIFCSNKEDILKALLRVDGENCSIYSLKNLSDHDDVQELQPSDIIYYYDDGILYDKNHVKVMDYDLNVKHEEERKKFADVDTAPDAQVNDEYDDRLTDADLQDKEAVANFRAINTRQLK